MKRPAFCIALLLLVLVGHSEAASKKPRLDGFLGTWRGKWDGYTWVQITVYRVAGNKRPGVLYQWEEHPGERPLSALRYWGKLDAQGFRIEKFLLIKLDPNNPERATATTTAREKRVARLVRLPNSERQRPVR